MCFVLRNLYFVWKFAFLSYIPPSPIAWVISFVTCSALPFSPPQAKATLKEAKKNCLFFSLFSQSFFPSALRNYTLGDALDTFLMLSWECSWDVSQQYQFVPCCSRLRSLCMNITFIVNTSRTQFTIMGGKLRSAKSLYNRRDCLYWKDLNKRQWGEGRGAPDGFDTRYRLLSGKMAVYRRLAPNFNDAAGTSCTQ